MNTPIKAMIWELWRTSRWDFLGRTLGQLLLVGLFYALTFTQFTTPESIPVVRGILLMILMMVSLFSTTWLSTLDSRQTGFCFRLGFTRPVSTATLVFVPMLFTMMAAVVGFLLPVLLFRLLFDGGMPFFGPAAAIACFVAVFMMTTWSPTSLFGKCVGIGTAILGMFWTVAGWHAMSGDADPILLVLGKPERFDLTWQESLGLLAVTLLACLVTVRAVDRQRHGASFQWKRPALWPRLGERKKGHPAPFSSPIAAQFWFELRRIAPRMLAWGMLVPLQVLFLMALTENEQPNWPYAPLAWVIALTAIPMLYQFIGTDGAVGLRHKEGAVQYSVFDATRPLRTDQLVMIKLSVIAACSLACWLIMAATAGAHVLFANEGDAWRRIGAGLSEVFGTVRFSWWWLAAACSLLLFYLSSSSVLLAFGLWVPLNGGKFFGVMVIGYVHVILAVMDAANANWTLRPLWITYGWVFAAAISFGSIAVLRKALASGSLGSRVFGVAFGLWVVYVASVVALYGKLAEWFPVPAAALAFGAAMLLVPLATTALAPLALASHRHR